VGLVQLPLSFPERSANVGSHWLSDPCRQSKRFDLGERLFLQGFCLMMRD
jgi:hypothetical protein